VAIRKVQGASPDLNISQKSLMAVEAWVEAMGEDRINFGKKGSFPTKEVKDRIKAGLDIKSDAVGDAWRLVKANRLGGCPDSVLQECRDGTAEVHRSYVRLNKQKRAQRGTTFSSVPSKPKRTKKKTANKTASDSTIAVQRELNVLLGNLSGAISMARKAVPKNSDFGEFLSRIDPLVRDMSTENFGLLMRHTH
jgi:hypothetical protein